MDFLVIDDDKVFREATCLLIEDEGHHAETAGSADVALTLIREENFDAVLLDVNLGRESGHAILPQILKIRPNMPVVMFSAQSTVKKAVQAIQLGAVDFLEKPFTRAVQHRRRPRAEIQPDGRADRAPRGGGEGEPRRAGGAPL
jgi:two-component system, NtrC family, response regulator AlgB